MGNPVAIRDGLIKNTYKANSIVPNTRTFCYDPRYRLVRATGRKHNTVVDGYDDVLVTTPDENDYEGYAFRYAYDEVGNFVRNDEYASGAHRHMNYKDGRIDLFNGPNAEAIDPDPEAGNWQYDDNGNTTKTPRHSELGYTFDSQPSYVDMGGGTEVRYLRHADQRVVRLVKKNGVYALDIYLGPFEYHDRQATTSYRKVVLHVEGHGRHAQVEEVITGTDSDSLDTFFVHGDHLGSGHVMTKDDGTLLSQEQYCPYGRSSDRRDARNRYRFIGAEKDEETGLSMTGPRTYEPVCGRFLQGDPLALKRGGWTPFHYSSGNPVRKVDRNGYQDSEIMDVGDLSPIETTGTDFSAERARPEPRPPIPRAEPPIGDDALLQAADFNAKSEYLDRYGDLLTHEQKMTLIESSPELLDRADYVREVEHHGAVLGADDAMVDKALRARAFTIPETGRVIVDSSKFDAETIDQTITHETGHLVSSPQVGLVLGWAVDEALTEIVARPIYQETSPGVEVLYPNTTSNVLKSATDAGLTQRDLAGMYFSGEGLEALESSVPGAEFGSIMDVYGN